MNVLEADIQKLGYSYNIVAAKMQPRAMKVLSTAVKNAHFKNPYRRRRKISKKAH